MALALWAGACPAAQVCDKPSKSGIKRCEDTFQSKDSSKPPWKAVTYRDRAGDMVDFEANFPKETDLVFPVVMIGSTMMLLHPASTQSERAKLLERLLDNAVKGKPEVIKVGRYEWTSARVGSNFIVRASRK